MPMPPLSPPSSSSQGQGLGTERWVGAKGAGWAAECYCSSWNHQQVVTGSYQPPQEARAGGGLPSTLPKHYICLPCGTCWRMKSPQTSESLGSPECPASLVLVEGRESPMNPHPPGWEAWGKHPHSARLLAVTFRAHQVTLTTCGSIFTHDQRNWTCLITKHCLEPMALLSIPRRPCPQTSVYGG